MRQKDGQLLMVSTGILLGTVERSEGPRDGEV